MVRTRVERIRSIPLGGGVIHDEESGGGLVVWVDGQRITAREAKQLEDNLNRDAHTKGRPLTPSEVLDQVPFVV